MDTLAREYARARHMTRRTMEEYLRDLGRDAAAMFPPGTEITEDHKALAVFLDVGITPAELVADARGIPALSPLAGLVPELVAVP
jgi:hypothetical protein